MLISIALLTLSERCVPFKPAVRFPRAKWNRNLVTIIDFAVILVPLYSSAEHELRALRRPNSFLKCGEVRRLKVGTGRCPGFERLSLQNAEREKTEKNAKCENQKSEFHFSRCTWNSRPRASIERKRKKLHHMRVSTEPSAWGRLINSGHFEASAGEPELLHGPMHKETGSKE